MPKDESFDPWVSADLGPAGGWLGREGAAEAAAGTACSAAGLPGASCETAAGGGSEACGFPRMSPHRLSRWLFSRMLAVLRSFLCPSSWAAALFSLGLLADAARRWARCLFQAPRPLSSGGRTGS